MMKRNILAVIVPALLVAGTANAAEIYNKDGNKVDLYGKAVGLHYFSKDNGVNSYGGNGDFSFIIKQNGMFSFSGLTKEQVLRLREEFGVYAVASGRVNVAGMTPDNMAPLCEAIVAVL